LIESFAQSIREAAARRRALCLRGGGSKDFYGNEPRGEILDTRGHAGIVSYEPSELVVTARCGTRLKDLEKILSESHQMLPFEPPHFGAGATLGGCVAAGLSGPRRAAAGALRDFVLGSRVLDGRGRALAFGGQVMKNVAGYDVSRLMAGSLGTLGLILEVSLKVLPRPQRELSLRKALPQADAIETLCRWGGQPVPVSASTWHDGELVVRLSGTEAAVRAAATKLGGESLSAEQAEAFWRGVREHTAPFFGGETPLWRLSLPPATPPLDLPGGHLLEWGAGLRWLKSAASAQAIRDAAARAGGHAMLFRARDKGAGCLAPPDPVKLRLHRELKAAFDPAGIFNPGRLYPEL
jgi:glycolate oxidase FAD binding subunit